MSLVEQLEGQWVYLIVVVLMMIGLYTVISRDNLVKKVMGLNIFQVSVIMFYVSLGKVDGGTAPIFEEMPHAEHADEHAGLSAPVPFHAETEEPHTAEPHEAAPHVPSHDAPAEHHEEHPHGDEAAVFSNPLPHVLMLTAIVVGIATTALGLALVVRIHEAYGTVEEDKIVALDRKEVA